MMAAGRTYEPIATNTLGSSQSEVTFNSFSGYTDLVLIVSATPVAAGTWNLEMRFNNDTGSNYSRTLISGDGANAISARYSNQTRINCSYNAALNSTASVHIIQIMNYANSTTNKTCLVRANNTAADGTDAIVNLWRNTNAITEIDLFTTGTSFATGSTFTLYGIAAA
jgi:hypothetical protein